MQRYIVGLALAIAAMGAAAQVEVEQQANRLTAAPVQDLPAGVTTEQHPLKRAFLAKGSAAPALFRPSDNMPEIVNEDLLGGMTASGKVPGKLGQFAGYPPKLKVLPCPTGCEGKEYERAVAEFIRGYAGDGKFFKERGEMIVQVRWFHARPFYMRSVPYSADFFGVSFLLEGKLVSLSKRSLVGQSDKAHEMARDIGARMGFELALTLGVGAKPSYLLSSNNASIGVRGKLGAVSTAVSGALGVDDVRSRIEPGTEAHAHLMPAIDGIAPGEIAPLTEMHYIDTIMF